MSDGLFEDPLPITLQETEEDREKASVLFVRPLPVTLVGVIDCGGP